jgi:hypothetical protein
VVDRNYDEDDEKVNPKDGMLFEFDCPECNAHNPYPDGFRDGGECLCYYCGSTFRARITEGRLRLKAT